MKARFKTIRFDFKFPAGTSRGVLLHKNSTFLILEEEDRIGIGECSTIPGLSIDTENGYFDCLEMVCNQLNNHSTIDLEDLQTFPSIAFGLETALIDLQSKKKNILFETDFTQGKTGIDINGLVWMGDKDFMLKQIQKKIAENFRCIKIKVGAIDFDTELSLLSFIRQKYSETDIEIRLDANGAFSEKDVMKKLEKLAGFGIHSIEQPVRQGQFDLMREVCSQSPIPIVLDEELIGVNKNREELLTYINPSYIILKPSLLGGFKSSGDWISLAKKHSIKYWITSALESNIGLNAIAQWTYTLQSELPQGLGTGQLYLNNIPAPLEIRDAKLFYNPLLNWDTDIVTN